MGDSPDVPTDDIPTDDVDPTADSADLGDGGRKALQVERSARKDAEKALRTAEQELEKARRTGATAVDQARAEAKAEARAELLAEANTRILRAEVKAAAVGRLRKPDYAVRLLDLSQFTVSDDGTVDENAIVSAIDTLVADDPDLAPQSVASRPRPLPGGGATPSDGVSINDQIRRLAGRR